MPPAYCEAVNVGKGGRGGNVYCGTVVVPPTRAGWGSCIESPAMLALRSLFLLDSPTKTVWRKIQFLSEAMNGNKV